METKRTVKPYLAEAGIVPSAGSVGDSYDNALAETVIGLFKTEVTHRLGPWRSREVVEIATLEWVDWFNTRRLLEAIGHIPPAEAEDRYYAELETRHVAGRIQANLPPGSPARFRSIAAISVALGPKGKGGPRSPPDPP